MGGLNLNKSLLYALGKTGVGVTHPLPLEWRKVVAQHGFKVARIRSALAWHGYVVLLLLYGMAAIALKLINGAKEKARSSFKIPGRFVYFDALTAGNLPQHDKNGHSHDIVTWYQQRYRKAGELDALCHSVEGAVTSTVEGIPVISVPSAIPPLTNFCALARFTVWGISASLLSITDLFRGHWWHPLLLREASTAAIVRMHAADKLARDYLFHNSGWIYRPLWTYEAEKRGSQIVFYFYSTNCESFKRPSSYPPMTYGWQAMNWPQYLVWDEYQADFVRRAVGERGYITVVGPIWFHASGNEVPVLPRKAVAVFDVQPMRDAYYQILGLDSEYYTPKTANQFLSDISDVLRECGGVLVLKRKRKIGKSAHPRYRRFVGKLDGRSNFVTMDPDISALRLIEDCVAVISTPFTSTAILGRKLGKPSIYYDPHGVLQRDDRGAHGIQILSGIDELREWVVAVFKDSLTRH